ncbi:MAG TPA: sulfatase [Planctomycetota bacterium]
MLIVSIDTLRADRLGCQGYARDTTPALDRLARERAVRFANAVAEAPWTLPSHVTLLSGLHPLTHGVRRPEEAPGDEVALLAELLGESHYSFALTDGGWISEAWGFARGFDSFHAQDRDVERAVEAVLEYVRHRAGKGPWLGFLHTYDVHCPYDPPEPYRGRYASPEAEPIEVEGRCGNPDFNAAGVTPGQARFLADRYDEDVRRVDDALGKLFAALDALDLWDETVVIVTSDHGEEFLEHGQIGHERTLSREVLAVPLLVAAPGIAPRVVSEVVGLADVVPTVLELVGRAPAPRLDGRSLVPLLRGAPDPGRAPFVVSELAWQAERVVRTAADGRAEMEPMAMVVDPHGLLKWRAEKLAAGYKPRPVDVARQAAELQALGYF